MLVRGEPFTLDLAALGARSTGPRAAFAKSKSTTTQVVSLTEERATIQKPQNLFAALRLLN